MFKYLILLGIFGGMFVASWQELPADVDVFFLDVGQGDATLIQARDGTTVLIDGGPDKAVLERIGRAMPWFDRSVEYLVLTHPEADHVTGLVEVARRYRVQHIVWTRVAHTHPAYIELQHLIQEKGIHEIVIDGPQSLSLGSLSGDILSPLAAPEKTLKMNDTSIVLHMTIRGKTFLFTGDITADVERALATVVDVKSDVLKVAHHGSRTSTSQEFLNDVQPEIAVIEVGEGNHFGHPTPEVLHRLEAIGAHVFRTDRDGTVKCSLAFQRFSCKRAFF